MGKNAKLTEKQKWSEEKIHLDNARKLRGIYFIDLEVPVAKITAKLSGRDYDQDLLADGKTPHERPFGEPFKGPIVPFGAMVECCPISKRDQSRLHQLGKKV